MSNINFTPLAEYPELGKYKEKYEGRIFYWGFQLLGSKGMGVVQYISMDLYRLALAVKQEEENKVDREERRKEFRKMIRESYYSDKDAISGNKLLNAILLSYCATYEGVEKLVNDPAKPEVGIIVCQDVDKDNDLLIAILHKEDYIGTYNKLLLGQELINII